MRSSSADVPLPGRFAVGDADVRFPGAEAPLAEKAGCQVPLWWNFAGSTSLSNIRPETLQECFDVIAPTPCHRKNGLVLEVKMESVAPRQRGSHHKLRQTLGLKDVPATRRFLT